MLPNPTFSFTIPSVYDDTLLSCRIYHPIKFSHNAAVGETSWRKKGAIVAPPYAALAGSFDDLVVHAAAAEILRKGFVVGTFNFRGSGSSEGRTSWTAKPELLDYVSFIGFFVHYLKGLQPPVPANLTSRAHDLSDNALSPIQSAFPIPNDAFKPSTPRMMIVLSGYSYGSMISTHLPPTESIIERFVDARQGTAEAEILLRAQRLAAQWSKEAVQQSEARRGRSPKANDSMRISSHSISMGGDETETGLRRPSREYRRSVEMVGRSMDRSRKRLGLSSHNSDYEATSSPLEEKLHLVEVDVPQTYYLLISPLLPPISMFATMFTKLNFTQKESSRPMRTTCRKSPTSASCSQENLTTNPTLAVWGTNDFFTSHKKLRKWAEQLAQKAESRFMYHEISGAGHFWHEDGVMARMTDTIGEWVEGIIKDMG